VTVWARRQYLDVAIAKCRELLDKTPELYEVLYAYGTALAGRQWSAKSGAVDSERAQLLRPAIETYQRAMSIFAGPAVLQRHACAICAICKRRVRGVGAGH